MATTIPVHVGFTVQVDPEALRRAVGVLADHFKTEVYVCMQHTQGTQSNNELENWFRRYKKKGSVQGFVTGVYSGGKDVVMEMTVEGHPVYTTVVHGSGRSPLAIKKAIGGGALGARIPVDRRYPS